MANNTALGIVRTTSFYWLLNCSIKIKCVSKIFRRHKLYLINSSNIPKLNSRLNSREEPSTPSTLTDQTSKAGIVFTHTNQFEPQTDEGFDRSRPNNPSIRVCVCKFVKIPRNVC